MNAVQSATVMSLTTLTTTTSKDALSHRDLNPRTLTLVVAILTYLASHAELSILDRQVPLFECTTNTSYYRTRKFFRGRHPIYYHTYNYTTRPSITVLSSSSFQSGLRR